MNDVDAQRGGNEQQVVFGDAHRAAFDLETVLRVALCQPASCNLTANLSCDQPLRWRSFLTCCRIKFSFFMATESESHAI